MTMFLLFLVGVIGWCVIRSQLPLSEWQNRLMWIISIVLLALPGFLGFQQHPTVTGVLWPFIAGVMAGELAWKRLKPKVDSFMAKASPTAPSKKRKKKRPPAPPPGL